MRMFSEKELKQSNNPIYAKRVKEMSDSEQELNAIFEKVIDWKNASQEDRREFLKFCHESFSVAVIKINDAIFPGEPKFLFKGDLYCEARDKIISSPAKARIAKVEKNDTCIYFRKPKQINRASWYRSEPRGEAAVLCSFFGHEAMGYINPNEEMEMWFKHLYGTLSYDRIESVTLEKTDVLFFEHALHILQIKTGRRK